MVVGNDFNLHIFNKYISLNLFYFFCKVWRLERGNYPLETVVAYFCCCLKFDNCSILFKSVIDLSDLKKFVHNIKLYFFLTLSF